MAAHTTVADYTAALPDGLRATARALVAVVEEALPGAGALWHGHPTWSLGAKPGRSPVCYIKAYSSYVTLGLWRGRALADPSGRLEPGAGEMAQVRLRSPGDVDAALFSDWLSRARALEG
ncbi:DUF1801 domain-containing protein [Nocardiopsis tropica]|uniref:DUF1801 domain-containing protein n=1 Tax=Nocardiopsis tropica TaxID=109330 RepID=A0ABU7KTN5_9ACTN|nr:DUF1801 domain-containing protein [Nocardiopsis umidischolae]MEE2052637.1 DUF1801 domain-containing protein [Nocardiopsis umidischolae]